MTVGPDHAATIRPLSADDAHSISAAFSAIGWNKPVEQYLRYAAEQSGGSRACWIATVHAQFAGYITLKWQSAYAALAAKGIPEIQDLNVLPPFRRRGIAGRLLDQAEQAASVRSATVGIGVGLHPAYNGAHRLYVERGYIPDELGVTYDNRYVQEGEQVRFDDALVLHFTKALRPL